MLCSVDCHVIGYFINYFINKQLIVFTAILLGFFWLVSVFLSKEILSSRIMRSSGKKPSVEYSCLCRVQASRQHQFQRQPYGASLVLSCKAATTYCDTCFVEYDRHKNLSRVLVKCDLEQCLIKFGFCNFRGFSTFLNFQLACFWLFTGWFIL